MNKTEDNTAAGCKENKLVDVFKFSAALLIVASHCLPLVRNDNINFFYKQWFFRFCVPFFFISAGFFFSSFQETHKRKYIKRIALIYLFSSLLYIPFYITNNLITIVWTALFGYIHLWYLSALVLALTILYILEKTPFCRIFNRLYPFLALLLILTGAFYDEYHHVFTRLNDIPLVKLIGKLIKFSGGHRHALFFAFPMILIGRFLYEHRETIRLPKTTCVILTIASLFASLAECLLLRHFGGDGITCDITLFNYFPAVFLFILTFSCRPKALESIHTRSVRKIADVVYISHVFLMHVVDKFLNVTHMPRFVLVLIASITVSSLYIKVEGTVKDKLKPVVGHQ